MYLEWLQVQNFRNISSSMIEFSPGFNYIYGPNGAGKTALLEAIYLLARGRSFRTHKIQPVISDGEKELLVRAGAKPDSREDGTEGRDHELAIAKSYGGATTLRLDGTSQARASSLARVLPVQTLLPDAAELIFGSPGLRRGFVDWGLFHVEPSFLDVSTRYRRVLAQRNAWLKTLEAPIQSLTADPWSQQLIELAAAVSVHRDQYVKTLTPYFQDLLRSLSEDLDIELSYDWGGLESTDLVEKKLSESLSRDVKFGMTHRGPHRADLRVHRKGHPAAESLSRGQGKLVASAASLAQAKLLYARTGVKCVFLIDDFGAELDESHWGLFLHTLLNLNCQVIATSTGPLDQQAGMEAVNNLAVFHVKHGVVTPSQETGPPG
jgi:DNA replication and repair protein RecF